MNQAEHERKRREFYSEMNDEAFVEEARKLRDQLKSIKESMRQ
jgi:hypothetical protein